MGQTRMPRHGPGIRIQRPTPASRDLHRRLVARVLTAAHAAALVTAGPADDLPRPAAGADRNRQRADRLGIAGVVGPVKTLFDHNRGFRPPAIDRLGHPLGRRVDLLDIDAGHLGRVFRLELVLGQQPLLPILETLGLEFSPGGSPLPRGVPRALAEAR